MSKVIIGLSSIAIEDIPSYMGSSIREKLEKICNTMANDFDRIESATVSLGEGNTASIIATGDYDEVIEALEDFKDINVLANYKIIKSGLPEAA